MTIFHLFDHLGTIAFAYSGFLVGMKKDLNVMGVFIVATLTATAGGATADVLIGHTPSVLTDQTGAILVIATLIAAALMQRFGIGQQDNSQVFVAMDSIGLITFAMIGAETAVSVGMPLFGTVVIAFISAVGGGIIRDTLVGEVPSVLHTDFYGVVAALCGLLVFSAHHTGIAHTVSYALIFILTLALRLLAYRKDWTIPRIR